MKLCKYFHIGLHFFEILKRMQTVLFCLKFSVEIRMCADYFSSQTCTFFITAIIQKAHFPRFRVTKNSNALFVSDFSGVHDDRRNFAISVSRRAFDRCPF